MRLDEERGHRTGEARVEISRQRIHDKPPLPDMSADEAAGVLRVNRKVVEVLRWAGRLEACSRDGNGSLNLISDKYVSFLTVSVSLPQFTTSAPGLECFVGCERFVD